MLAIWFKETFTWKLQWKKHVKTSTPKLNTCAIMQNPSPTHTQTCGLYYITYHVVTTICCHNYNPRKGPYCKILLMLVRIVNYDVVIITCSIVATLWRWHCGLWLLLFNTGHRVSRSLWALTLPISSANYPAEVCHRFRTTVPARWLWSEGRVLCKLSRIGEFTDCEFVDHIIT